MDSSIGETKPTLTEATKTTVQLQRQVADLKEQLATVDLQRRQAIAQAEQQSMRPSETADSARVLTVLEQACKWFDKHQRVFGLAAPPFWYDEAKMHLER